MVFPARRMHERFPCQLALQICIDGGSAREGRLVNAGQVIWVAATDPMDRTWTFCGVQFTNDDATRSNLRLLVDYVRSKKA